MGADQTVLAVSPDLRVLAVQLPGTVRLHQFDTDLIIEPTGGAVIDTSDGRQLSTFPLLTHELLVTPIAIDPTRPHVVYPSGLGTLAVADWKQFGISEFAGSATRTRRNAHVVLAPDGTTVDLTPVMHQLGLDPNDAPPTGTSTWTSTTSRAGAVAVLTSRGIAIWDPASGRVVRTLTGAPPKCATAPAHDLSFEGSATAGRVVLGCDPTLYSWDLASKRATPQWTEPWAETRDDEPIGPMLTPDHTTIVVPSGFAPLKFLDAKTGRRGRRARRFSSTSSSGPRCLRTAERWRRCTCRATSTSSTRAPGSCGRCSRAPRV